MSGNDRRESLPTRHRKLNSIGYGGPFLAVGGGLFLVLPGILVLSYSALHYEFLLPLARLSMLAGGGVLILFGILLVIEFVQDRRADDRYRRSRRTKSRLADGRYECQSCGYRGLSETDRTCPACNQEVA